MGFGIGQPMSWMAWLKFCLTKADEGIGFRDLESFNLALLAKQAWRIKTQPHLLMSQIVKARYFPHESFELAVLGGRPSATWRSILRARDFFANGP